MTWKELNQKAENEESERIIRIQRLYSASEACPLGLLMPLVVGLDDPDA